MWLTRVLAIQSEQVEVRTGGHNRLRSVPAPSVGQVAAGASGGSSHAVKRQTPTNVYRLRHQTESRLDPPDGPTEARGIVTTMELGKMATPTEQMRLFTIGGVQGVGKTTVLAKLRQVDPQIEVIFVSKELETLSIAVNGQPFSKQELQERGRLRQTYADILETQLRSSSQPTLLDLHYIDPREDASVILHPPKLLSNISVFILLDAPDEVIVDRRSKDTTRERTPVLESIRSDRESQYLALHRLTSTYHRPGIVIPANQAVDDIISELLRYIR